MYKALLFFFLDDRAELEEAEDRFVEQHVTPADDDITVVTPEDDKPVSSFFSPRTQNIINKGPYNSCISKFIIPKRLFP